MNENDVRNAMKQALRADAEGEPDLEVIIQGGRRQRRAVMRKAALGAAVLAVAGLGMSYGMTHTQTRPQSQSVTPDLAGQARTPSLPPHDNSHAALAKAHAAVRAALAGRLPAGMTLEDGSGLSNFYLVRSDGTTTSLGAEVGLQSLAGLKNPCTTSNYNTNCRPVSLSDGSRGWAWETDAGQKEGHAVSVVVYTQDGHAWGLSDGDGATDPASSKTLEKGEPLTEAQLISLVFDPQVMAALKQVSTDQVTSAQTTQSAPPSPTR
jgi:hypothetical protein